ncbi:MAG: 3-dehydroquinate synthase [Candidatus Krumholzibacteria bacterium]|jgi:3-dehydroquinate synthase|nr:3-dehydroquinate synthase [Candidatus Krumholzibacteria bacterium]MDP6669592.1 3-dehydroquinate synthase [Candidatus Krumholzibacteria bacterium]MDP6797277.1 3-dehydroquinate synthase [Candidatus Krumholzibacteria bacterium]MDP7020789.1 3-dehydroquinate synthase [Candidatus Krumholzibacteria bacterium]
METLQLSLGDRSYPIHIGRELDSELLNRQIAGRKAVALVDAGLASCQQERLESWLADLPRLEVPRGESSKSLSMMESLARQVLDTGLGRDGLILSVGGGVTGDLAGFLAASYLRGVPYIHVPTTLLSQVDSSVGGKVAVNLPGAKNAIGAFHQPEAVFTDLAFLDTLDRRQRMSGLAEILKMAAISDAELLETLVSRSRVIFDQNAEDLAAAILRTCLRKAEVVSADEKEQGQRAILNFGHTLGHALESHPETELLHGEAVSIGMLFALKLSGNRGMSSPAQYSQMESLLETWNLPTRIPDFLPPYSLVSGMKVDKKRKDGRLQFVLVSGWGEATFGHGVEEEELLDLISSMM